MPPNEPFNKEEEVLKNLDVQLFMATLNDLLTGKKRLVIESAPMDTSPAGATTSQRMKHTFKVEDVK